METTRLADEPAACHAPVIPPGPAGANYSPLFDAVARPALALPIITAVGALLYLLNLGGYPFYTKGEPREAVTVFDIVHGGGVILPRRAGVEVPSKPLLMHWLAALVSVVAGGVSEWTVRMPSALCAIAGMLVCYLYVRRLFDQRAGLVAALILGTTFQYVQAGSGARVDITLTFFMELAFFEFIMIAEGLSGRVTLLYLAMALAMLTKGPIGVALPVMVAAIWIVLYRRWALIPQLRLVRGAMIVALIGGGWYIAAIVVGGSAFVHKQILAENLYRLIPHHAVNEGHAHPFYYEEGALLAGLMPWTPLAGLAAIQFWHAPRRLDSRFGYLLIWILAILVFFNLPQSKRGIYLLAFYPALSALVAIILCDTIAAGDPFARVTAFCSRAFGLTIVVAGGLAAVALVMLYLAPGLMEAAFRSCGIQLPQLTSQLTAQCEAWPLEVMLILLALVAAGIYLMRRPPALIRLMIALAAAQLAVVLAINLVVEPVIAKTLALKDFAADARRFAGSNPVGYFGNLDYGFAYYNGRDLRLTSPIDANAPALIISPEDDWKLVPPRLSVNYKIVLRSNPTDLDGSGQMLLLEHIPAPPSSLHV